MPAAKRFGTKTPSQTVSSIEIGPAGVALIVKSTDVATLSQPFCELVT